MKAIRIDLDTVPLPKPSAGMMHLLVDGEDYGVDGLYLVEIPDTNKSGVEAQLLASGDFVRCDDCGALRHKGAIRTIVDSETLSNVCMGNCKLTGDDGVPFKPLTEIVKNLPAY